MEESVRLSRLAADYRKFADDLAHDDCEAATDMEATLGKCNCCEAMTSGFHCADCLSLTADALDRFGAAAVQRT